MKKMLFLLCLSTIILSGCSKKNEFTIIKATDNGWDSQKLHNALAKLVIENAFEGYKMEFSTASSNMNWISLTNGEVDVDIESWTDNVVSYESDIQKGLIQEVGVLLPDSSQGFYVPRYVIEGNEERGILAIAPDLKTVKDLKKYPHIFPDDENPGKGRIYGSIPGWMADEILYKKYIAYGLNEQYNYIRLGSESSLFASLASSYNLGKAWVGYCFEPTWAAGKYDLILLEDDPYDKVLFEEGKSSFPSQQLKIVSHNSLMKKAPEVYQFLTNYVTNSALISNALAYMDENSKSHDETAVWILTEHPNLIDQWLDPAPAKALKTFLNI